MFVCETDCVSSGLGWDGGGGEEGTLGMILCGVGRFADDVCIVRKA